MRDSRSFLANAAIYGLGSIATQVASAILLPLYTHYLNPADYGVLEILDRTGQIITVLLLGNGIQMATFSFYCQAKTHNDRQRTFSSIAFVLWSLLGLGALCAIILAPNLASAFQIDSPRLVVLGIAVVLLQGAMTLPTALMQARVDSVAFVTVNLLAAVTRLTLIIVAVVVLGLGVWGVLGASALCAGIFAVILTLREVARGFPWPDRTTTTKVVRFALPLLPAGIFGIVLVSGDRFFLLYYTTRAEVGTYSLGFKLAVMVPMLFVQPLWKVWTARLYSLFDSPNAPLIVGRMITRLLAVRVFMGLGLCLFGYEVVALLATHEYMDAALVIPLLTVASTLEFASYLFDSSFWAKQRTQWKPLIVGTSTCVAGMAFFFLVPRFGSVGAAMALTLAYSAHVCVTFMLAQRVSAITYNWVALSVGVAAAILIFFLGMSLGHGIVSVIAKLCLWLTWPVLLWVLGIVNPEEKAWAQRQVDRLRHFITTFCLAKASHPD